LKLRRLPLLLLLLLKPRLLPLLPLLTLLLLPLLLLPPLPSNSGIRQEKTGALRRFFYALWALIHLLGLENLAPAKPIHLISHTYPFLFAIQNRA